jgi:hypothetical protein
MTVIAEHTCFSTTGIDNGKLDVIRASRHRPVPPYHRPGPETDDIYTDGG